MGLLMYFCFLFAPIWTILNLTVLALYAVFSTDSRLNLRVGLALQAYTIANDSDWIGWVNQIWHSVEKVVDY